MPSPPVGVVVDALPATVGTPASGDGSLEPLVAVGEEDGVLRWLLVVELPDAVVVAFEDALPVSGCEFVVVWLWEELSPEVSNGVDSDTGAGEAVLVVC